MQQYLQLILASTGTHSRSRSSAVAFTSALPGEGVSYVVQSFGAELARQTGKRVLLADSRRVKSIDVTDHLLMPRCCLRTNVSNLWQLPFENAPGVTRALHTAQLVSWRNKGEEEIDHVRTLRLSFDFILIDCPSLAASTDAAMLAPSVDGMVVVVEAGNTNRQQITRARQTLEMAKDNFLGFVLNKRRYPVPSWLYRRL